MNVRHLQLLRELADRGSITAVAEATHRTPSAVSQQLRTAQHELGTALVEPAGRGLRLTDAGRLLAAGAVEVDTAIERVRARWEEFRHGPGGTVTIAIVPSAAELLLPALLRTLAETPITAHCRDLDIAETAYAALAVEDDIVVFTPAAPPPATETLTRRVLLREPLDIALPTDHRLAAKPELSPSDVVDEDWIALPEGYPFNTVLTRIEDATGRTARVSHRILDNRVTEMLVAAGHGIALLPRFTTRDDGIALRPLTDIPAARHVTAVARPDRAQRGAVAQTLDTLARIARAVGTT